MIPECITEEIAITYGEAGGERLLLDSFRPLAHRGHLAVVILIHGGGMWTGSRADMREPAREFARSGFAAFAIDYRLVDAASGRNRWPAQLDDAQTAVRWVRAHAADYGVDPDRIAAFGWSAGGQLAALLGTRETPVHADVSPISSRVERTVVLAGDIDLAEYTEPPARDEVIALLGGTVADVPAQFKDASPLTWIDDSTVPFLILHGLQDDVVPIDQSRRLAAALRAAGVPTRYLELPGIGHHDLSWDRVKTEVLAFLGGMTPQTSGDA
jgi:acetyl esterase/lipase